MSRRARLFGSCFVAALAGLVAVGQPPASPPAKLTPAQLEKLKVRTGFVTEALALERGGKVAAARVAAEKCLAIERDVFGDLHPSVADSLSWLTRLCIQLEDFPAARKYAKEALDDWKKIHGDSHWKTTDARLALADVELLAELPKEKRAELKTADQLLRDVRQLDSRREYVKALEMAERALFIRQTILGEKHRRVAVTLGWLGSLYQSLGNYPQAQQAYLQALAIKKVVLGEKHPHYAISLATLGYLYNQQGLYAKTEPLYKEALTICKEVLGVKHPDYATSLNNLASLYSEQGLYTKAEPLFKEALDIKKEVLGEKHPDYALGLNNLGLLYSRQGLYAKAEPLYKEARDIWKEAFGEKHPKYAISLNNLASLYDAQALYAKAEPLYKEALAIRKEVFGEKHPEYAQSLNNLAGLYESQNLFTKAEPLYKEALAIRKEVLGERHPDYASSLNNLAVLYSSQSLFAKAMPLHKDAIRIMEDHLEQTAASQSEADQFIYTAQTRIYLNNLLPLPRTDVAEMYEVVFRWRGAVTARQAFARAARDTDPKVRGTLKELHSIAFQLSNLVNSPPQPGVAISERQKELNDKRETLEKQLAGQSQSFAKYREHRALTVADIQKLLPADAVLIDFLAYRDKVAAFIVTSKSVTRVDLQGGKELARLVKDFRSSVSLKRTRPVQGEADESPLYAAVWEPLLPHLKEAKLVLICPDGSLCEVPFAALRGTDPKKYLIEEVALAVIPVPRLLPELLAPRPARQPEPSLLAIGDVDFDGDPAAGKKPKEAPALSPTRGGGALGWSALPGSKAEVEVIEKFFRKAASKGEFKSLTKGEASEAAIRREVGKYRYLHFATHGFFAAPTGLAPADKDGGIWLGDRVRAAGLSPGLLCGLVCAGANRPTPDDDGVLTALEIADLDLSRVEIAVLSACQTGLGEIAGGDGVLGLQRAFQLAGARTTVTSLWSVPDDATSALMTRFYANRFEKGLSALEALREAQLWMLNNPKWARNPGGGHRTPPVNWAAFVLAGDWR